VWRRNTERDTWAIALNKTQGKLQPRWLSSGNHHSLVDHENLAHLLPSTKLMIIARKTATYNTTMQRNG